jgi:hypothetical protein
MGSPWEEPSDPHHATLVSAVLSCAFSFGVVVTFVLFPRLQNKLFMKIITLISLCDCIANASQLNGLPVTRELCVLQAMTQQFFYPASWMWTVIMTYLLYSLVVYGRITIPEWKMHVIVWGICTTITFLPLTTSTYGKQNGDNFWCWIEPSSHYSASIVATEIWEYLTFDCVIFGCFLLMTGWGSLIFYKLRIQHVKATKTVKTAIRTLFAYPVIICLTWFPTAMLITIFPTVSQQSTAWIVCECLSLWQGGLTAIVFFRNSRESRMLWYGLLTQCFRCNWLAQRPSELPDRVTGDRFTNVVAEDYDEVDFESDDAYYGRFQQERSFSVGTPQSRDVNAIALAEYTNPIYQ